MSRDVDAGGSPGGWRPLPAQIPPLVLVGRINWKPRREALGLLNEQVASGAVEAHHPAVEKAVFPKDASEGHAPVVDKEVHVRFPRQIIERRKGELDPLRLRRVRSASDRVVAAVTATPDRYPESICRRPVEQGEWRPCVDQRLDSPSLPLVAEDDLDGRPGNLDDRSASRDDPFFGAVREGVVASWQLANPDHEAVGRRRDELDRGVRSFLAHVSHEDDKVAGVGRSGDDPPVLDGHPLACVVVDPGGPAQRLDRPTRPRDAHVVKVPTAGQRSLSHAAIL